MTILGPAVSLKQVGDDTGQPKGQLGGIHTRARLKDKKTGPISLKSLAGATTSMCADQVGLALDWNTPPSNTYQSFLAVQDGQGIVFQTPSSDWTKDLRVGGNRYSDNDAIFSVYQCGYSEGGDYKFEAVARGFSGLASAPFSIAIVANSSFWLQGEMETIFYQTAISAGEVPIVIQVLPPPGKPYITVCCYQFVYGPLNQEGVGAAPIGVVYTSEFRDARIGAFA